MRNTIEYSTAAGVLAAAILMSNAAFAYEATALEKAELAQLTPQLRSEVQARLSGEQTVRGILETMLLNKISLIFASDRVVAVDFDKGVAVVEGKDGKIRTFPFDVTTEGNDLIINGKRVKGLQVGDPTKLGWGDLNIEVAMECSGRFTKRDDAAKHLQAGAKKVLI